MYTIQVYFIIRINIYCIYYVHCTFLIRYYIPIVVIRFLAFLKGYLKFFYRIRLKYILNEVVYTFKSFIYAAYYIDSIINRLPILLYLCMYISNRHCQNNLDTINKHPMVYSHHLNASFVESS